MEKTMLSENYKKYFKKFINLRSHCTRVPMDAY